MDMNIMTRKKNAYNDSVNKNGQFYDRFGPIVFWV